MFALYFVNLLYYIDLWILKVALVVKNPPASAGDARDVGSIPGLGRSPGEGNSNSVQCSCLGNLKGRGAWWATVHGVAKSQARLSDFTYFKSSCQRRPQLKGKHQRGFLGNTEKAAVWCVISSSVKTEVTHWRLKLCIHLIERLRLQKYSRGLEMVFSGGASGKESTW